MLDARVADRGVPGPREARVVHREAELVQVLEPRVNVVWCRRARPSAEVRDALSALARSDIELHRDLVADEPGALDELFADRIDPALDPAFAFLRADLAVLVPLFGRLVSQRHVHLELSTMRGDGCRKLHADQIGLRLLVTYAGPGTDWAPDEHVDRRALARYDLGPEVANALIVPRPEGLRRAHAFDVLVLKGDAWRGNEGSGAVHRSPPIERAARVRLVLKLDQRRCGC